MSETKKPNGSIANPSNRKKFRELSDEDRKKQYRFDMWELEDACIKGYAEWKEDKDNDDIRVAMFESFRKIAYAVTSLGNYSKLGLNYDEVAYEYALYLYDRIAFRGFRPEPKETNPDEQRFPWNKYVTLNIKGIIYAKAAENSWQDMVGDFESLLEAHRSDDPELVNASQPDSGLDKYYFSKMLFQQMRMLYTESEMLRLFPFSIDLMNTFMNFKVRDNLPTDIKSFCINLYSVAKRICRDNNLSYTFNPKMKDFKSAFESALRSSIFMSLVSEGSIIDKELVISLDIDSLQRIVQICGGKTIKIPTQSQLDSMMGATTAIAQNIISGKPISESVYQSKHDLELSFPFNAHLQLVISKMMEAYDIKMKDNHTQPMITLLTSSICTLQKMFDTLASQTDKVSASDLMKSYLDLSTTFTTMTDSLIRVSQERDQELSM
jgi:hypothetical protein